MQISGAILFLSESLKCKSIIPPAGIPPDKYVYLVLRLAFLCLNSVRFIFDISYGQQSGDLSEQLLMNHLRHDGI